MPSLRLATLTALVLVATPATAADSSSFDDATKAAIRSVITRQLAALDRDDGDTAESLASKALRDKFPTGQGFMAMVHAHYAALLHAKSTAFGTTEPSPHGPLQKLTIVAADGTVWNAIYSFKEENGAWRITGCGIEQDKSQQAI